MVTVGGFVRATATTAQDNSQKQQRYGEVSSSHDRHRAGPDVTSRCPTGSHGRHITGGESATMRVLVVEDDETLAEIIAEGCVSTISWST